MAKIVYGPMKAECVHAEPANEAKALDWGTWRRKYVGRIGMVAVYASEHKSPGRPFLCFYHPENTEWQQGEGARHDEEDWWLKTYYGEWVFVKNRLFFRTRNTFYVFRIIREWE